MLNFTHAINEFRCYEAKIEESKKPAATGSRTQDTSGLSRQCSDTEPRQPDNHQPSQFSIGITQVVPNFSVAHLATTQPLRPPLPLRPPSGCQVWWLSSCRNEARFVHSFPSLASFPGLTPRLHNFNVRIPEHGSLGRRLGLAIVFLH